MMIMNFVVNYCFFPVADFYFVSSHGENIKAKHEKREEAILVLLDKLSTSTFVELQK